MAKEKGPSADSGSAVQPGKGVQPPASGGVHPPTPDFNAGGGKKGWFGSKR